MYHEEQWETKNLKTAPFTVSPPQIKQLGIKYI